MAPRLKSLILGTTLWKEKTDFRKLSSDPHMFAVAFGVYFHTLAHVKTHKCKKKNLGTVNI